MKTGVNNFTAERVAELRKNIDLSDIPEIKEEDFSQGHLRNPPQQVEFKLMLDKDVYEALLSSNENIQIFANKVLRQAVLTA